MFGRRRRTGLGRTLAVIAVAAAAIFVVWGAGLIRFVAGLPQEVEDLTTRTDAIVVLTGGSERLDVGFALLAADMAGKLFVSGVYRGVEVDQLLSLSARAPDDLSCCIELGRMAADTEGNAAETAIWVKDRNLGSIRLVTAGYHMPRSLFEFRMRMPDTVIVPHPVFPGAVRHDRWWAFPGTFRLIVGEYNKLLGARLRHLLFGTSRAVLPSAIEDNS